MFSITFYKNTAEPNRVDKTNFIEEVVTLNGVLREATSLTSPTVSIEIGDSRPIELDIPPNFNYAYIPQFKRYYFITDITSLSTNLWEITMSCDVLMSYKEELLNCVGFIDRNENFYAPYSIDRNRVVREGSRLSEIYATGTHFPNIIDLNIEGEAFQSEMCVVLNGYRLESVWR